MIRFYNTVLWYMQSYTLHIFLIIIIMTVLLIITIFIFYYCMLWRDQLLFSFIVQTASRCFDLVLEKWKLIDWVDDHF